MRRRLTFVLGICLLAAVAGYGGFVATLRFRTVPPVPDSLPLRVQKDLQQDLQQDVREMSQCINREVDAWRAALRARMAENPDAPWPPLLTSELHLSIQQRKATARCVAMLQMKRKQAVGRPG